MKNLLFLLIVSLPFGLFSMPMDSIGTKVINGKAYTLHKVSRGEGVYGIGKRYGVPASEIFAANEGAEKSIMVGQVLMIPRGAAKPDNTVRTGSVSTSKTEKVYHTVAKGQTLSAIARMHGTTVAKIKELNHLKSDNIMLGQKLVVGEKTTVVHTPQTEPVVIPEPEPEPAPVPAPQPAPKTGQQAPLNDPSGTYRQGTSEAPAQKNVVVNTDAPADNSSGTVNASYNTDDGDEITENGTAMISAEGELGQERSFILHPTAKIGTIVMITNPVNNNTVFARVVGNCKPEQGIILKMSKTVAAKLGVNENTEVKVSYAK